MVTHEVAIAYDHKIQHNAPNIIPIRIAYTTPYTQMPYNLGAMLAPIQCMEWKEDGDESTIGQKLNQLIPHSSFHEPLPTDPLPAFDSQWLKELDASGGAVQLESHFYVERQVDSQAKLQILRKGVTLRIKGSRQIGKTSLLARLSHYANEHNFPVMYTDFQESDDSHFIDLETLLRYLADRTAEERQTNNGPDHYWKSPLGPKDKITRFLAREVLEQTSNPFVFMMDEVDRLFAYERYRWVEGYLLPSLENAELRVWSDRKIQPGQVWASEIEKTITQSRNMLVVLSPVGVASSLLELEYKSFLPLTSPKRNRHLIPLLLTPTRVPPYLAQYQCINFTDESRWNEATQELLLALGVSKLQDFDSYSHEAFKLLPSKKRYNTATIRKLLDVAFDDEDLSAFIYDYYRPLHPSSEEIQKTESTDLPSELWNLTSKSGKIQLLIEYAGQAKIYDKLLDDIARERPRHYAKYADQLEMSDDALS